MAVEPPAEVWQNLASMVRHGRIEIVLWGAIDPGPCPVAFRLTDALLSPSGHIDLQRVWDRRPSAIHRTVAVVHDMRSVILQQRLCCYPILGDAARWNHCLTYLFLQSRLPAEPSSGCSA